MSFGMSIRVHFDSKMYFSYYRVSYVMTSFGSYYWARKNMYHLFITGNQYFLLFSH